MKLRIFILRNPQTVVNQIFKPAALQAIIGFNTNRYSEPQEIVVNLGIPLLTIGNLIKNFRLELPQLNGATIAENILSLINLSMLIPLLNGLISLTSQYTL